MNLSFKVFSVQYDTTSSNDDSIIVFTTEIVLFTPHLQFTIFATEITKAMLKHTIDSLHFDFKQASNLKNMV